MFKKALLPAAVSGAALSVFAYATGFFKGVGEDLPSPFVQLLCGFVIFFVIVLAALCLINSMKGGGGASSGGKKKKR